MFRFTSYTKIEGSDCQMSVVKFYFKTRSWGSESGLSTPRSSQGLLQGVWDFVPIKYIFCESNILLQWYTCRISECWAGIWGRLGYSQVSWKVLYPLVPLSSGSNQSNIEVLMSTCRDTAWPTMPLSPGTPILLPSSQDRVLRSQHPLHMVWGLRVTLFTKPLKHRSVFSERVHLAV